MNMFEVQPERYYKNNLGDIVNIRYEFDDGSLLDSDNRQYTATGEVPGFDVFNLCESLTQEQVDQYISERFHPEIEMDDAWKAYYDINSLEIPMLSQIGPHERRELNLMIAGYKPVAMIHEIIWGPDCIALCEKYNFTYEEDERGGAYVAVPGEHWRINALKCLLVCLRGDLIPIDSDFDSTIGRLLGYSQEDIDFYTIRLRKLRAYKVQFSNSTAEPEHAT